MHQNTKIKLLFLLLSICFLHGSILNAQCGNLYIAGVLDGPLTGGTPKGIQFCATGNIADLSIYGVGVANNGGGTDGEEYNFPADAINSGDCIWIGYEGSNVGNFNAFMGFDACYLDGIANINGDDPIELYCNAAVVDVYGDVALDGTGQPWEYLDGWAVSADAVANPVWDVTQWTYSGINVLDGETTNATAATPYPNTMVMCPMAPPAPDVILISEISLCTNTVELFNAGTAATDVSTWQLCNRNAASGAPFYAAINTLAVTGSTMMMPGDYITIVWSKIEGPTGELGLYINGSGFANAANIHDYMQFNAGGNIRASVAVTAGVWDNAANFVTVDDQVGCATTIANAADPASSNSTTWCDAQMSTLGMANSACVSNIVCPAVGDLVISEIMQNPSAVPDGDGEYFEVYNASANPIDMMGFVIRDNGSNMFTVATSVTIAPGAYAVFANNDGTVNSNGGIPTVDYAYPSGFALGNGSDQVIIECNGTIIDIVDYDNGTTFPDPAGASMQLDPILLDAVNNDIGSNWCESTSAFGSGDLGTPGSANSVCAAVCGIGFLDATPNFVCATSTAGVDAVSVEVQYGGVDPSAVLDITVNGVTVANTGSDPNVVAGGTIIFMASEGDMFTVTFTDALCLTLISTGTISGSQCPDPAVCGDLYFLGAIDGPLSGGTPKAVQLCASANIPDLSVYGLESVSNGGGATGVEYNFPPGPLSAGDCIWVASEGVEFMNFFGFAPCYVSGVVSINGDDALQLYCAGGIVDALGDPNCDPNALPPTDPLDCGIWEFQDGWIFASDNVQNPVFDDTEWTYSGENALDGETTNATAVTPYPMPGTACPDTLFPTGGCPDDYANGGLPNSQAPLTGTQSVSFDYEAAGDIESDQMIAAGTMVDYDSGTMILLEPDFETILGAAFHAFIDGCGGAMLRPDVQNKTE